MGFSFTGRHAKRAVDALFLTSLALWTFAVGDNIVRILRDRTSVYSMEKGIFTHIDFLTFYMASKIVMSPEDRHNLYDPVVQLKYYNEIISPAKITKTGYVQNPPYFFFLIAPVGLLPLRESYLLWNASSIMFGIAGLCLLSRASVVRTKLEYVVFALGAVTCFPSCDSIFDGQFTWWLVGLMSILFWAIIKRRDLIASLLLSIMSIKPHFALVMALPALIDKRWRLMGQTAAFVLILIALSGIFIGWDNLIRWPQFLMYSETTDNYAMVFPERMVSLRGPASLFLANKPAFSLSSLAFAAGLLLSLWCWWKALVKKEFKSQWCVAVTILCLLNFCPHMHIYDCVLLAIPAMLTLPAVLPSKLAGIKKFPFAYKLWCWLMISYPPASLCMMVVPPMIATLFSSAIPASICEKLAVNDAKFALLAFHAYFVFDLILLGLALKCVRIDPCEAGEACRELPS